MNRLDTPDDLVAFVEAAEGRGHTRLEVEAISGTIARLGREAGVATPVNGLVYACLKPYAKGIDCYLVGIEAKWWRSERSICAQRISTNRPLLDR